MSYSLLRRLSLGSFFSLVSAFMLLWLLIHISVQYLIYDYIYTRLTHDSETLLAASIKNPQHIENNFTILLMSINSLFRGIIMK